MLIGGAGLGAGLMYMLDPDRGRRRRALARDQVARLANRAPRVWGATARDVGNRLRGMVAEIGSRFSAGEAPDDVLVARVRSKMGRVVSHPSAIEVMVDQGRVTLRGPILADEVEDLISCVSSVPGVADINNQLEAHKEPGSVPGLQGGRRRPGERFELMQENWSPAARLLASVAGGALAAYGLGRRSPVSLTVGAIGAALLARGVTNMEMRRLIGMGGGRTWRAEAWRDEVGKSGVYPVSRSEGASPDAVVHGLSSWGQGERGAAGYEDSGGSELTYLGKELGVIGGSSPGEGGAYKRGS